MGNVQETLTERQQREIAYHREHAKLRADVLEKPFSYEVLYARPRRWWNAYWEMYTFLTNFPLKGKKVLVVGCGFGEDALRIARIVADVHAFDISADSVSMAKQLATREGLVIDIREMAAEQLDYPDDFFDCVVARDILHHVDVPLTMKEIVRVAKEGALFLINEIYSHSITGRVRHAAVVEKYLYPAMQNFIYKGEKPYITEDERKLTEKDIALITRPIEKFYTKKYFNFLVTRIIPDKCDVVNKLDRLLLILAGPIAPWLSGRVLLAGPIHKVPEFGAADTR